LENAHDESRGAVTQAPPEHGVHAALWVRMQIVIDGADAVEGDTIALGAALADLRREGWHLESIKVRRDFTARPDKLVAVLIRDWKVDAESLQGQRRAAKGSAMGAVPMTSEYPYPSKMHRPDDHNLDLCADCGERYEDHHAEDYAGYSRCKDGGFFGRMTAEDAPLPRARPRDDHAGTDGAGGGAVRILFTVEIDAAGLRRYRKEYPELARLDAGQPINTLIRETIAAWELQGIVKPGAKGEAR
jgi:hypothetical protein